MRPEPTGATFIRVPLSHGCVLILTPAEYHRGLKRGKLERRRESNEKRQRGGGSILEAIDDGRSSQTYAAGQNKSQKGQV